jgi:hypothetical protein
VLSHHFWSTALGSGVDLPAFACPVAGGPLAAEIQPFHRTPWRRAWALFAGTEPNLMLFTDEMLFEKAVSVWCLAWLSTIGS